MSFPTWKTILLLVIVWAAALFAVDFALDPHSAIWNRSQVSAQVAAADGQAHIRIWLRYPCRNTCLPAVSDALKPLTWMGPATLVPYKKIIEEQGAASGDAAYDLESTLTVNRLEAVVTDPSAVDFVQVIDALGSLGLVADQIEYVGVGHYTVDARLEALRDLSSRGDAIIAMDQVLADATTAIDHLVTEYRGKGYYGWFDSVNVAPGSETPDVMGVDPVSGALRFYPDLGATVDIMEVVRGLAQIGLKPSSITIGTEAPR